MQYINQWQWTDYADVGSTNDEVKLLTSHAKGHKYIVTAQKQHQGRGRRGRSWIGMDGNLFMSLALEVDLSLWGQMVFVTSLSLLETILHLFPKADAKLKWPNDVLVSGRKISGILLEKGEGDYLIIGIGVNIKQAPALADLIYPTVSLAELGFETDRIAFMRQYMTIFDCNLQQLLHEGFIGLRDRWLSHAAALEKTIKVTTANQNLNGIFSGVDNNGALLLNINGKIEKIYAGDVFFTHNN